MKVISNLIIICLLAFCSANRIHAFENFNYYNDCSDPLSEHQRIDQVVTNEQGVFLLIDSYWIRTQGMQATQEGIFVLENGEWISLAEAKRKDNNYVWKCPICGTWNNQTGRPCSNSKNHPK